MVARTRNTWWCPLFDCQNSVRWCDSIVYNNNQSNYKEENWFLFVCFIRLPSPLLSPFCFYSIFKRAFVEYVHSGSCMKLYWHNQIYKRRDKAEKNDRISSNGKQQLFVCVRSFGIWIKRHFTFPSFAFCFVKFEANPHFIEAEKCTICIVAYHFPYCYQFYSLSLPISLSFSLSLSLGLYENYSTNINKFKLEMIYADMMKVNAWRWWWWCGPSILYRLYRIWPFLPKHNSLNFNATNIYNEHI